MSTKEKILNDNLFELSLSLLPSKEIEAIYSQAENDSADILKDKILSKLQEEIRKENINLSKFSNIRKYLLDNNLQSVVLSTCENSINNGNTITAKKILDGFYQSDDAKAKLSSDSSFQIQKDFLFAKADFQNIKNKIFQENIRKKLGSSNSAILKSLSDRLDNLDKEVSQKFGANIGLVSHKVNKLRIDINTEKFKTKLELIDFVSINKKNELNKLITEYKTYLQKNMFLAQNILQKYGELVKNSQAKMMPILSKLKNMELANNLQTYLKLYMELGKTDEKLFSLYKNYNKYPDKNAVNNNILILQKDLLDKIAKIKIFAEKANAKFSSELQNEVKNFIKLNEEFYYQMRFVNQLKDFLQEDLSNVAILFNQISIMENFSKMPLIYLSESVNYMNILQILSKKINNSSNIATFQINSRNALNASIFTLDNEIYLYGDITVEVKNFLKETRLTFYGNNININNKKNLEKTYKIEYIFRDPDDAIKYVMTSLKNNDYFNLIQDVKLLKKF